MNKERVQLCWASDVRSNALGNAYGYRVHNQTLRKYTEKYADLTPEAKDAMFILSPEFFSTKFEDKRNWLFTMFEGVDIPDFFTKSIQQADMLLVPSTWVKELFTKIFDPLKIFVVPHGVEPMYSYIHRTYPILTPFRFLWVGAPNPRKGYEEVIGLWDALFASNPEFELYVKTTGSGKIERRHNIIFDSRNISKEDLVTLYHSSHCFLFPTRGEGFGLTLAEAMATGMPAIATGFSGHMDFFSEAVGWPISYEIKDAELTVVEGEHKGEKFATRTSYCNVVEFAEAMIEVVSDYKKAVERASWGARLLRTKFTWDNSAKTLVNILREHGG
jgi:O-antigen biosynthesis alpha-1,2-mannosyltransferase